MENNSNLNGAEGKSVQVELKKDILLLDVKALINAQLREFDKTNTKNICKQFLEFALNKGLLKDNPFTEKENLLP